MGRSCDGKHELSSNVSRPDLGERLPRVGEGHRFDLGILQLALLDGRGKSFEGLGRDCGRDVARDDAARPRRLVVGGTYAGRDMSTGPDLIGESQDLVLIAKAQAVMTRSYGGR